MVLLVLVVILEPFIVQGDVAHSNVHVHECLNSHSSLVRFNQCLGVDILISVLQCLGVVFAARVNVS